MRQKQPLLSICIPTYNRAKILKVSLERFEKEFNTIDQSEVEFYVSDNCSNDETPQVVKQAQEKGLPINFNRNSENVGPDCNFLYCMNHAAGKYVWLLGDDDFIIPGSLIYLLDLIRNNDFGLIHLSILKKPKFSEDVVIFNNSDEFLKNVSYWITFMSGSIFLREAVAAIPNHEQYKSTNLLQVPFFIQSSLMRKQNAFVCKRFLDGGQVAESNGGYNFYNVFVENLLSIWEKFLQKSVITQNTYDFIKKDLLCSFITPYNYLFLFRGRNIATKRNPHGFQVQGAWKILFKNYGTELYFYKSFFSIFSFGIKDFVKRIKQI